MPTDLPRRQTTSQFRPVLASRSKATRNRAGSMLGSSIVILAPVEERSCTTHWRAPKPPSKVIQPRWCSDLRGCEKLRRLVARQALDLPSKTSFPAACPAAQTPLYVRAPPSGPIRRDTGSARRHRKPKALIRRVYLFETTAKRQCRDRVGRGEADVFAPFVYWLGRHPFTVESAVRFR